MITLKKHYFEGKAKDQIKFRSFKIGDSCGLKPVGDSGLKRVRVCVRERERENVGECVCGCVRAREEVLNM